MNLNLRPKEECMFDEISYLSCSVENEGNLKAYLQFLFSLFKINDVESV